jgi:hypothetical protein
LVRGAIDVDGRIGFAFAAYADLAPIPMAVIRTASTSAFFSERFDFAFARDGAAACLTAFVVGIELARRFAADLQWSGVWIRIGRLDAMLG